MAENPQVLEYQVSQTSSEGGLCWRVDAGGPWKPMSYFQGFSDVRPENHHVPRLFFSLTGHHVKSQEQTKSQLWISRSQEAMD